MHAGDSLPHARMTSVPTLSFRDARECVLARVSAARTLPAIDEVGLDCAAGRVLARDARADRDYPPLARSVRDGFAVQESAVRQDGNPSVLLTIMKTGSVSTLDIVDQVKKEVLPRSRAAARYSFQAVAVLPCVWWHWARLSKVPDDATIA